jgi:hypothetical protein
LPDLVDGVGVAMSDVAHHRCRLAENLPPRDVATMLGR